MSSAPTPTDVSAPDDTDGGPAFADLGLRPELLRALTAPRLRGADADPAGGDPAAAGGPRPARPGGDRHRQDRRVRAADAAAARRTATAAATRSALVLVPTRELADAGVRGDPPVRPGPRRPGAAGLRRPADRPPAAGAATAASTSSSPRPGRALDHIGRGTLRLGEVATVVLDEADEMLDMGFAEDIEAILAETPDEPADRAVLGHHAAADRRHRPPAPAATRCGSRSAASRRRRARRRWSGRARTSSPRAHKPAALGRVLDVEAPDRGDRVLPHPRGGRPAHRDAQRPRLPRRGAARRHEPGAARPGDGPAARRHRRPAGRHRRRRPRPGHRAAHPRRQLRRAVGAGVLRAPHRPGRAGPAARAWRSPSPSRASTGCSRPSSG